MILRYMQNTKGSDLVKKKPEYDAEINEIKGKIPDINHLNKKKTDFHEKKSHIEKNILLLLFKINLGAK